MRQSPTARHEHEPPNPTTMAKEHTNSSEATASHRSDMPQQKGKMKSQTDHTQVQSNNQQTLAELRPTVQRKGNKTKYWRLKQY